MAQILGAEMTIDFKDPTNLRFSILTENIDYLIEVLKAYLSKPEIYPTPTTAYIDGDTVCLTAEYSDDDGWETEDYLFPLCLLHSDNPIVAAKETRQHERANNLARRNEYLQREIVRLTEEILQNQNKISSLRKLIDE
jgi:hypothetical protein